jgi:hypothetical protein
LPAAILPIWIAHLLFKLSSAGVETVLYPFGLNPTMLIQGSDGNFYGTTGAGGASGGGALFKF